MSKPIEELLGLHKLQLPFFDAFVIESCQINYVFSEETDLQAVLILFDKVYSEGWIHSHYLCQVYHFNLIFLDQLVIKLSQTCFLHFLPDLIIVFFLFILNNLPLTRVNREILNFLLLLQRSLSQKESFNSGSQLNNGPFEVSDECLGLLQNCRCLYLIFVVTHLIYCVHSN